MPVLPEQAPVYLASHTGPLGQGWSEVDTFDALDPDEYDLEEEDEEEYITLDLGPEMDSKWLQTEGTYQLIGMDTGLPFLKIGNTILQGEVTPLIGTEVILGLIRNQENPLHPSHPPLYTTTKRVTFRPITLSRLDEALPEQAFLPKNSTTGNIDVDGDIGMDTEEGRSLFLKQDARYGPNAPEKLPGRKRDRDRAARRAERLAARSSGDGGDDETMEDTTTSPIGEYGPTPSITNTPSNPTITPRPGLLSSPVRPDGNATPASSTGNTPRYPGHSSNVTPIGRPRTRPVVEITTIQELAHLDIDSLPTNIRVMVLPDVINDLDPSSPKVEDAMHLPKRPLEFTRGQIKKLVNGTKPKGQGSRFRNNRWENLAPAAEGKSSSLPSSFSTSRVEGEDTTLSTPRATITSSTSMLGSEPRVVQWKTRERDGVDVPQFITRGGPRPSAPARRTGVEAGAEAEALAGPLEDVLPEMRLDMRDEEAAQKRNEGMEE